MGFGWKFFILFFFFCDWVGIFKSHKNVYNFGSSNPTSGNLLVGKISKEGGTFLYLFFHD